MLSDITVVELSAFVAAPYAGLSLAQFGATVIRIDPIGGGLDYKRWPITANGESLYWAGLNKGKKSITINLKDPRGQELAQSLMTAPGDGQGLILTNLKAQGWLDFKVLEKLRKDIVMVNIIGNMDGSVAVDYTVNARTGFPSATGPENSEDVVNHVLPVWDIVTGQAATNAILLADRHRKSTGEGQYIKISLANSAFSTLSHLGYLGEVEINQYDRPKMGNHVFGTFACDFSTKDNRRVMVTAFTKNHWISLQKATETLQHFTNFELERGTNLGLEQNRYRYRKRIQKDLMPWFSGKTLKEIATIFDQHQVCWGPYQNFRQAVEEDPHLSKDNPMIEEINQPGIGKYRAAGSFIDFSKSPRQALKAAPQLGQNTDEVLANCLKLTQKQIGVLRDKGIVSGPQNCDQ